LHLRRLRVSYVEAVDYLKDNFEFIFMERLNYLAVKCSSAYKKIYLLAKKTKKITKAKVNARLWKCEREVAVNKDLKDLIKNYNHICITYEEHIKPDPRIGADLITKHFNIYHDYDYKRYINHYHAKKNKWSDIKLADKIANFDSLKKEFINTKYEWMLWE